MRITGKELALGLLFAGAAVGVATMGGRDTAPYPYLFDRSKATTDQQRFLSAVMAHHGVTEAELAPLRPRLRSIWRDLPMIVFVAREAKRPLVDVAEMRGAGKEWIEVYRELELPLKALFEGVPGTAPEPYKAAWTEWRMKYRPQLDDDQMRALGVLQMTRRVSGEDVDKILKQVRRGTTPEQVIARAEPDSPEAATAERGEDTGKAAPAKSSRRATK